MAGFDTRNALNLAIRALSKAALERNAGGWIPPREQERQQRDAMRQDQQQARQAEKQQQAQQKQFISDEKERQKNLMAWHKQSHDITKNPDGTPKVFYHGTRGDFSTFNLDQKTNQRKNNPVGIYVTPRSSEASHYSSDHDENIENANVMPVYVHVKNPFMRGSKVTPEMLRLFGEEVAKNNPNLGADYVQSKVNYMKRSGDEGRDAISIFPSMDLPSDVKTRVLQAGGYDGFTDGVHLIAFDPSQIKSATGNQGTFDPSNPDITKSDGGPILSKQYPTHYMPNVGRQVMADGGSPLQPTFDAENVAAAQVSPKPGKTYGQLGGKTMNQQRIESISRKAKNILESDPVRNLVKNHFKISNYEITPVLGTWENEPEPSFRITGKNMTPQQASKLASFFSLGMWQDAAVHSVHHPEADLDNGTPTVLIGHGGVLTPEERQNILSASAEHKRDLTFTRDGKAAVFSHFGDASEHPQFVDDIENIRQKAGMPEALMVRTAGDLTDAKNYLQKIVGGTRARERLEGGSGQPSDLFRGLVDHIAAPFTRAAEEEGYRFSTQKFADFHKLTDAERNYFFSKVVPPERRPPSGIGYGRPTVRNPVGYEYPGIYGDPRALVAEAASRVAPESENLKNLFGVTRADLYEIGKNRVGNMEPTLAMAPNPKGSAAAENIMTPQNEERLRNILEEAGKYHGLRHGMDAWYVMDPLFQRMVRQFGLDEAKNRYKVLNTLTGMASPGSEVPTEINRGMAAYYMHNQGRFPEFVEHGGKSAERRGADFPAEIADVMGHPYHSTSQAGPMQRFLQSGEVEMGTPKVPTYIPASGVPEIGFQTKFPVPDAHYTRIIGMGDTRTSMDPGVSMKMPEYQQVAPWWERNIANPMGLQSVAAQARIWGAGSGATGVSSPIGAPKLEMFADYIAGRAARHGINSEDAMKRILEGSMYQEGGSVYEPHKRAEEQGYSIKGYHVTRGSRAGMISSAKRFDPYMTGSPGEEAVFFWDKPEAANDWAHYVVGTKSFDPKEMSEHNIDRAERHATSIMPVRINKGKHLEINWPEITGYDSYDNKSMSKVIDHARSNGYDTIRIKNMHEADMLPNDVYPKDWPVPPDQIAVLNPAMIRSEFAEFDPHRQGRDDIGAARGGTIYREGLAGGGNPGDIAGGGYGDGNIGGGTPNGGGSDTPTTGGDQYGGDQYGGNDNYSGSGGRDTYTSYGDGGPDLSIGGPQGLTGAAAFGRPELGTDTYNLDNAPPTTVGAKLAASPNIGADLVKEAVNPDLGTANSPFASGAQSYDQTALDAINERMKTDQQVLRDAAVQRTIGDRPSTIGIPNAPTSTANMYNMVGGPLTEGSYADAQSIYNQRLYNSVFGPEKETGAQISVPNAGDLYGATNAPLAIQQTPVSAPSPTANQSLEEYMGTVPPADMQQMITKQLQKTNQFNVNVKDFLDATGSPLSYATTYGMALPKLAEKNINFQPGQKIDPATGLPATGIATFTGNMNAKLTPEQQAAKDEFDKQFGKTFTPITKTTYGVEERGPMMGGDLTGPSMTFDSFSQMAPQEQTEAQTPVVASDVMRGTMGITPPAPAEPRVGMPQLAQQPIQIPQSQTQAQTNPSVPSYSSSLQPQQTIRQNFEQAFADARASGAQTFYWTNPKTGVTSLYGTKIARKEGGRVPSFNEPDEWLAEKNESKKNAVKKANKRMPKPERSPIVGRALMLSSSKS